MGKLYRMVQPERLLILVARCFSIGFNNQLLYMRAEGTRYWDVMTLSRLRTFGTHFVVAN
ncbi:hypothetical protein [Bacteroides sp. 51]|uniref:hypothetical protein n=1 Tax=Bacteroides sp. 51 TaxID=2302938 RepID=UPI0013CFF9F7|nr:hypothetical protein [Bacteroides sp. 51]